MFNKNEYAKEYYQRPEVKAYRKKHAKEYRENLRKEVLFFLGNECVRCGFDDPRALQIDHVNGGGIKESKMFNGVQYYQKLLKNFNLFTDYQLLCANCNWIKRVENKEYRN